VVLWHASGIWQRLPERKSTEHLTARGAWKHQSDGPAERNRVRRQPKPKHRSRSESPADEKTSTGARIPPLRKRGPGLRQA